MLQAFLQESKNRIQKYLRSFLDGTEDDITAAIPLYKTITGDLFDYAVSGKMLRGSLCFLGHDLFSESEHPGMIPLSGALEMVQSAFLIHDDIMDRDDLRRGREAMHATWRRRLEDRGIPEAGHVGESLAICAGDIALFLAYRMLAAGCGPAAPELTALASREFTAVATAQMLDALYGTAWTEVCEEDILRMYTLKTGRYTFSLPLSAGALLGGAPEETRNRMERIGDALGVAFQLKDDDLGLFGDEAQIGKPVGSDIREGKRTLVYLRLAKALGKDDDLLAVFGRDDAGEKEIARIRDTVEALGIRKALLTMAADYTRQAMKELDEIRYLSENPRRLLSDLAEYNLSRGK